MIDAELGKVVDVRTTDQQEPVDDMGASEHV